ncbi:MAG: aldehyde dehydrogenase family protein, partial [Spongiibacteraceae bacterium]
MSITQQQGLADMITATGSESTSLTDDKFRDFESIQAVLLQQRSSFNHDDFPNLTIREDRLDRLIALLRDNKQRFSDALASDYGARSHFDSVVFDVLVPIESLKYLRKNTGKWMRPEKRGAKPPLNLLGASAEIFYQPLGVVGIVAPWNFPVQLTFSPLGNAISAGNRAMIKPSELTPATSALIAETIADRFYPEEIAVINGGPETASAFTQQAFDHLVFTGAPSVAKHVMRAAAENLVPLTLELGGKCPVIIGEGADLKSAVERIFTFKT